MKRDMVSKLNGADRGSIWGRRKGKSRLRPLVPGLIALVVIGCLCAISNTSQRWNGAGQSYGAASENSMGCEPYTASVNDTCTYVRNAPACAPAGRWNYLELPLCVRSAQERWLVEAALLLWMVFLFMALSVAADEFFSTNLAALSEYMKLSQNVAGVTLLALGNGAPDIFSSLVAISKGGAMTGLAVAELLGAGLFICTIVLGAIAITAPTNVTRRPFVRDVVFYLLASLLLTATVWWRRIYFIEALGFCAVYILYVAVVVFGRYIYQRRKRTLTCIMQGDSTCVNIITDFNNESQSAIAHTTAATTTHTPVVVPDIVVSNIEVENETMDTEHIRGRLEALNKSFSHQTRSADHSPIRGSASADDDVLVPRVPLVRARSWGYHSNHSNDQHSVLGSTGSPVVLHRHVHNQHCVERGHHYCPLSVTKDHSRPGHSSGRRSGFGIREGLDLSELVGIAALGSAAINRELHMHTDMDLLVASGRTSPMLAFEDGHSLFGEATERDSLLGRSVKDYGLYDIRSIGTGTIGDMTKHVLWSIAPVSWTEWEDTDWLGKFLIVVHAPVTTLLTYTVPVVNMDEVNDQWNKPLHMVQATCAPVLLLLMLNGWCFIAAICVAIGILSILVLALRTESHTAPKFHALVAVVGFVMSVVWIKLIATELVSLLSALGALFTISPDTMGMTVLAWANSMMDFVSDMAMARTGFPQMAIAATFGGPLLNTLIGIGLACSSAAYSSDPFPIITGKATSVTALYLLAVLVGILVTVPICGFRFTRMFGFTLFAIYGIYMVHLVIVLIG